MEIVGKTKDGQIIVLMSQDEFDIAEERPRREAKLSDGLRNCVDFLTEYVDEPTRAKKAPVPGAKKEKTRARPPRQKKKKLAPKVPPAPRHIPAPAVTEKKAKPTGYKHVVVSIFKAARTPLSIGQILEKLKEEGVKPTSLDPGKALGVMFATNKELFERIGTATYILKGLEMKRTPEDIKCIHNNME